MLRRKLDLILVLITKNQVCWIQGRPFH